MNPKNTSMSIRLTKEILRSKILLRIKIHKEEERKRKSRIIGKKLFKNRIFKKAKVIMFYFSFGGEVSTKEMIKAAKKLGKIIAVPVCKNACNRIMKPCLLTSGTRLEKGPYGVREPVEHDPIDIKNLDLVIVPGLAFDKKGNRLGRGKGYYDMFLKELSPTTSSIGLAYDFQSLPLVPTTKMDVSVDKVIFA